MGVILNLPRNASIVAKDKVQTLKIPANRFIKLVTENPDAALEVMRQLSKKISLTSEMAIASKNELRELRELKS
jgi:CRP-like cAMP-binding protein